jgi:hypothetical protein
MIKSFGITALALAVAATTFPGCSSSPIAPERQAVVHTMQDVYEDLGDGTKEVQRAVAYLDQLEKGGDIKTTLTGYSDAVAELKDAAEDSEKRGVEFRIEREEYLARWDAELAAIPNRDIKETAEQRQQRVREGYAKITVLADEVRQAYAPFVQKLESIKTAMSFDATRAGVDAIRPQIKSAKQDGEILTKKLDALGHEINAMMGRMDVASSR